MISIVCLHNYFDLYANASIWNRYNAQLQLQSFSLVALVAPATRMEISAVATLLLVAAFNVESARILGIFHFPSKSHHMLGSTLLKALATKGHQVTMLSPYPLKSPVKNYEDIELTGILEYGAENRVHFMDLQNMSGIQRMEKVNSHIQTINEMFLNHSAVQSLLSSGRNFDLVVQIWFFNSAHLGIANHFKAPVVLFNTHTAMGSVSILTGNPTPYSYVPFLYSSYPSDMTFFQRVGNTLLHLTSELQEHFINQPQQEALLSKYFPSAPALQQLMKNVSLVLLNSHFSIENPRPYLPNLVSIGGFHIEDADELTVELQSFLDSATEGVLFFSLGSNLRISDMPKDKIEAIARSFRNIPLKVLWKFESEDIPDVSSNVKIGKWLPQKKILAHPNTKIFVTHGGMLSTIEAVYFGVPVVGIPFFADQHHNMADCVKNGYGITLSYNELTEQTLTSVIMEMLMNVKYKENIKIRSMALKDQPLKPLDNAIYWVEYVLKYNGSLYLKARAVELRWYQYYLIDVVAFLVGIVFISILLVYVGLKMLLKLIMQMLRKPKTD